jgi:hypothetical protein
MLVSLKKDLNINKSAIRNNIDRFVEECGLEDERMELAMDTLTLLHQRGDSYTPNEVMMIISWYVTSHDECVWDNPDDFHPLQVYAVNKKVEKYEAAINFINGLN